MADLGQCAVAEIGRCVVGELDRHVVGELDHVLSKLDGVKPTGNGYTALFPEAMRETKVPATGCTLPACGVPVPVIDLPWLARFGPGSETKSPNKRDGF